MASGTTEKELQEQQSNSCNDVYVDGCLRIEHSNYYIACDSRTIRLARKDFLILSRLALSPERIVSSEDIWRYAWGEAVVFNPRSLYVHIHKIRHLLAPFCVKIETLSHVGYCLKGASNLRLE
jgi:two-component system, OmpR family, alkaline phosphatase synthesis response regulator PhoP